MAWMVDVVIAFMLLEAALLLAWRRRSGRGPAPADLALMLGGGLCLLLALRGALAGAGAAWLGGWLAAAGIVHGLDLARRWPRG